MAIENISIDLVDPNPFQVRHLTSTSLSEESFREFANQIEKAGYWKTPLRARAVEGRYQLAWGQRRLEALKRIGIEEVSLDVLDLDDDAMKVETVAENFHRVDLTEAEKLSAFQMINVSPRNPDEVMQILGIKLDSFNRFAKLAMYEENSAQVRDAIRGGQASARTVAAADAFGGDRMVAAAIDNGMTSRDIEKISSELRKLSPEYGNMMTENLKEMVVAGQISAVHELKEKAEELREAEFRRAQDEQDAPAGLVELVKTWIDDLPRLTYKVKTVTPHFAAMQELDGELASQLNEYIEELERALQSLRELSPEHV